MPAFFDFNPKTEKELKKKEILIVAAEASSEPYAYQLLAYWQTNLGTKNWKSFGIGSTRMESLGFECSTYSHELTGLRPFYIYSRLRALVKECQRRQVFCALLMDYGGFNLALAKQLHRMKIPVIYYIPPKLWAWYPSRVKKIKKYVKKVLVIFPFEVDFFRKYDVPVEFVGHPLLKEAKSLEGRSLLEERSRLGLKKGEYVLGLMPGSRDAEIKQHLHLQLEVAKELCRRNPQVPLRVLLLLAPTQSRAWVQEQIGSKKSNENLGFSYILLQDEPAKMICLTDILLVASGTATLLAGLLQKPMVVMYRLNTFLYGLVRCIVNKEVRYTSWVNLLLQREVVPECIQKKAQVLSITPLLEKYLKNPSYREDVIQKLGTLRAILSPRPQEVVGRVTEIIQEVLEEQNEIDK